MRKSMSVLVTSVLAAAGMAIAAPQATAATVTYGPQETVLDSTSTSHYPYGVAVDPSGNVYATDANNKQLVEVPAGGARRRCSGPPA